MTNKMTTEGKVWLVGGHDKFPKTRELSDQEDVGHYLEEREYTILLTEDLLNRSFMSDPETFANFHTSALRGLSLDGFISLVSFGVEPSEKGGTIIHPKMVWGKIYLASTGELALDFSHDTRKDQYPFYYLAGWLEKDWEEDPHMENWTTRKWREFLLKRIQRKADSLRDRASKLRSDPSKAQYLAGLAERIQLQLPHR